MQRADTHKGFVWSVDGDNITVALHAGGKLTTPNKGGFVTGDKVVIIFDASKSVVLHVWHRDPIETAIRCGSDPIFEAAIRTAETLPESEEEVLDGDICEQPTDILYCGG